MQPTMTKEKLASEVGVSVAIVEGWMKKHWVRGVHYAEGFDGAVTIRRGKVSEWFEGLRHEQQPVKRKPIERPQNVTTELYRYFDPAGSLLYIGISLHTVSRAQSHRSSADWWDDATRIEIERHPSREAAMDAEKVAIQRERPKFNKMHSVR